MFPAHLHQQILNVYGQSLGTRWIFSANAALGGVSPKEAVDQGRLKDVISLVNIAQEIKLRKMAESEYIDVRVVEDEVYQLMPKRD